MNRQQHSGQMYEIEVLRHELEALASNLSNRRNAFGEMSIRPPRFEPPELGFYQAVTWLYTYYYEAGLVSLKFLTEQFSKHQLDSQGKNLEHYDDVQRLRTFLQHNLNLDSERDASLQRRCHDWFSRSCGSAMPRDDEDWDTCLASVLGFAQEFFRAVIDCVRAIERNESRNIIGEQWAFRIDRFHPKHEFERLVAIVIYDIGQEALDPSRITERFYDRWTNYLRNRESGYNFEDEGRRLVEQTILAEKGSLSPLSGEHIKREFGIGPGLRVGQLLEMSTRLYWDSPCTKEELLERLKETVRDSW